VSRVGRAAARIVVRHFPASWRARYESEVLELIEDSDSSIGDAVDLAADAARQHVLGGTPMRLDSAHRHPGAFALVAALLLLPTLAVVALSLVGHELGVVAVARAVDPVIVALSSVRVIDLGLVVAPLVAFVVAVLPLLDLRLERAQAASVLALRVRAVPVNVVVAALALLVGAALVGHIVTESVLEIGA
jgi:hypothetical protein